MSRKITTGEIALVVEAIFGRSRELNRGTTQRDIKLPRGVLRKAERDGLLRSRHLNVKGQVFNQYSIPRWKPLPRLMWWWILIKRAVRKCARWIGIAK